MIYKKLKIDLRVIVIVVVIFMSGCVHMKRGSNAEYAFGAIADCQYCAIEGKGARRYSLSKDKLKSTVTHFNTMDLVYVVQLGDFIDRGFENFDVLNPIYNQLKAPKYHVLGNHDFSVADDLKKDVPRKMGLPSKYYDFAVKGWRYVVLDGNDVSFHAYPKNSDEYKQAEAYYKTNKVKSPKWNGAIGSEQYSWVEKVLEKATRKGEKVILFCHFPVYPKNAHNLWNAEALIELLESYTCVKAYINGHNHQGNYAVKEGIHYLTLKGMVETEENSYAVIRVDGKAIHVTGYGREENRVMLHQNQAPE